jgi:hypothetical protein
MKQIERDLSIKEPNTHKKEKANVFPRKKGLKSEFPGFWAIRFSHLEILNSLSPSINFQPKKLFFLFLSHKQIV